MKRIFVLMVVCMVPFLMSCNQEGNVLSDKIENYSDVANLNYNMPNDMDSFFGQLHNDLLEKFYMEKYTSIKMTLSGKINLFDGYLSELIGVEEGLFEDIVKSNTSNIFKYLELIDDTSSDCGTARFIINDMYKNAQITNNEKTCFLSIIDLYADYDYGNEQKLAGLYNDLLIRRNQLSNMDISAAEERNLQIVYDIAIASTEFWNQKSQSKGWRDWAAPKWLVRDVAGAMTAVQIGLVQYTILATGGNAAVGAAVLVGCAAVSSAISD